MSCPTECPKCQDEDCIDALDTSGGDDEHIEHWSCGNCEAQWDAIYTFSRVELRA